MTISFTDMPTSVSSISQAQTTASALKTVTLNTPSKSSNSEVKSSNERTNISNNIDDCYTNIFGFKIFNPMLFILQEPVYIFAIPYMLLWVWVMYKTGKQTPKWPSYFYNHPTFLLLIPYVLGQPLFKWYVNASNIYENNKDACKKIMAGYNLIMSVFSFYAATSLTYCLIYTVPNGILNVGHFNEKTGIYAWTCYLFYISKYIEFLDTYFLILCGRPVTWLQYIHHFGAPITFGLLYLSKSEGNWIIVVFNGFIHTIMYYYYACCILKWPFPWKRMITVLQLIQFASGGVGFAFYVHIKEFWDDDYKRFTWWVTYDYVGLLIILFSHFYHKNYIVAKRKPKSKSA